MANGESIDPPYPLIAEELLGGRVVPFLGAGVNLGGRDPTARPWPDAGLDFLPSGGELSRDLARVCKYPSEAEHDRTNLAKVASFFVETGGRPTLRSRLHRVFARDYVPLPIHEYLAEVAAVRPLLVVTTNYDDLLERAFVARGCRFDLVIHPTDREDVGASVLWRPHGATEVRPEPPNSLSIDFKTTSAIYKIHGSVWRAAGPDPDSTTEAGDQDQYVITEEDYVDFLYRMAAQGVVPASFIKHFRNRHFLFLGHGLADWNLRVILRNLRAGRPSTGSGVGDVPSWAIQFRPSALERELWQARNVKIYDQEINRFATGLREALPVKRSAP